MTWKKLKKDSNESMDNNLQDVKTNIICLTNDDPEHNQTN